MCPSLPEHRSFSRRKKDSLVPVGFDRRRHRAIYSTKRFNDFFVRNRQTVVKAYRLLLEWRKSLELVEPGRPPVEGLNFVERDGIRIEKNSTGDIKGVHSLMPGKGTFIVTAGGQKFMLKVKLRAAVEGDVILLQTFQDRLDADGGKFKGMNARIADSYFAKISPGMSFYVSEFFDKDRVLTVSEAPPEIAGKMSDFCQFHNKKEKNVFYEPSTNTIIVFDYY